MSSVAFPTAAAAAAGTVDERPFLPPSGTLRSEAPKFFVVPAYNEAENLPRLLADLESRPALLTPGSRIIVVDDGSEDGTVDLLRGYEGPLPVELIELGRNQGPGAAFRAGFAAALERCEGEALVVTLEADTTSDLDALPSMLERAAAGAELVLASVHKGGRIQNVGRWRRLLSLGAAFAVRKGLKVDASTVSSFFRVYRASALRGATAAYGADLIQERGFACKAELLSKLTRLGARIEEVPVDLDGGRRIGESKMRILPTIVGYWRVMLRQRIARSFSA